MKYTDQYKSPGGYMAVYGGHRVFLEDPKPEDFHPYRTGYGLAHESRYCGNYGDFRVAQHSVLVARVIRSLGGSSRQQLAGVHHEDEESVTGDIPHPVKKLLKAYCPEFVAMQERFTRAINARYGVRIDEEIVKEADRIVFCGELRWLVPESAWELYGDYGDPFYESRFQPRAEDFIIWSPDRALKEYLGMHERLTRGL